MDQRILVPVDFTDAADNALELASVLSQKTGQSITLLNVEQSKSTDGNRLKDLAEKVCHEKGIGCEFVTARGSIFKAIPEVACEDCYHFMILGSHGFKGIREKFTGTDILKLVKKIPIPVLVIQKGASIPAGGIKKIVLPAATHKTFHGIVEATAWIAGIFDAEVHIYTVEKPGMEWSDELKANVEMAKQLFERKNIRHTRVIEKQTTYALGYSKQILKYATENKADLISVMSVPTAEHYYFADADKELLLTNEARIPVLCTSGLKVI
ncbi:MAG: universal stress protein [Bacteroidales bacterium]